VGVIWACADDDESDYSVFAPEFFVSKQYSPFFYASYEWYYGIGYAESSNTQFNNINVEDWYQHFNKHFAKRTLQNLLVNASENGIDSALQYFNGKLAHLAGSSPDSIIDKKQAIDFLNYLKLANYCENFSVYKGQTEWDSIKQQHSPTRLEPSLLTAFKNEGDAFTKERLWFQTVRYYYFSENSTANIKAVQFFDQHKNEFPKNLTYYRALGYVAGYYNSRKNYAQANYLYSLCYNYSYDMKIASYWSFHPQNESDWNATLQLAKSPEEKITLWQMMGVEYDAGRAIRAIAAINPKSEKLDLLLSRLVNSNESLAWDKKTPDSVKRSFLTDLKMVESIAQKNNTAKPYYWDLAAGYLNFISKNYAASAKFYADAKKRFPANDKMVLAQSKILNIMLYVKRIKQIDARTETQLTEPLNWLADLNDKKVTIPDLRFDNARNTCAHLIAKSYARQGNYIKALFFGYDSLGVYADSSKTEEAIKLLNKTDKTPFEKAMIRYYQYNVNDLYYHQAIRLAFLGRTPQAIAYLKKRPLKDFVLYANPFNGRLVDCHDCDAEAHQKQKFTPLSFLQTLDNMQQEIKTGKNIYRDAYLVANAYYNMTYYGNARLFYESDSVIFSNMYYIDPDSLDRKYMSMRMAEKYYQLARTNALNDEEKARCTFMLSKCALNEIYNHTDKRTLDYGEYIEVPNPTDKKNRSYYSYFDELKTKYSKTDYFREALQECGYFKKYINSK
jgi:hypothetical protein